MVATIVNIAEARATRAVLAHASTHEDDAIVTAARMRAVHGNKFDRMSTGIPEVDAVLGGGIARHGVTLFAERVTHERISIGQLVALSVKHSRSMVYFSVGLEEFDVCMRWCAHELRAPAGLVRGASSSNSVLMKKRSALMQKFRASRSIYFCDDPWGDVEFLSRQMRNISTGLIVADYTGMNGPLDEVLQDMRLISDRHSIPAIVICSLSHGYFANGMGAPGLSDINVHDSLDCADDVILVQHLDNSPLLNISKTKLLNAGMISGASGRVA